MGIIFGLFHGSVWRFLPTAILGGVLTYIMLETENMFYPALFHFTNNFLPLFSQAFREMLHRQRQPQNYWFSREFLLPF